ncbi:MAG: hypothetical protein FWH14_03265 [Oscillospiraceae bacterium]|nr:hypothetical protein [Oscillospiraceae bacterium]
MKGKILFYVIITIAALFLLSEVAVFFFLLRRIFRIVGMITLIVLAVVVYVKFTEKKK